MRLTVIRRRWVLEYWRATAVMEFAIASPVLVLYFFVAASDFGSGPGGIPVAWRTQWRKAGYYAFRTGPTVSQSAVAALVRNASPLSIPGANITATDPTRCYCPSGNPATLGSAHADCTTPCLVRHPPPGTI